MARYMRSYGNSTLSSPVVVQGGVAFYGPRVRLSPSSRKIQSQTLLRPFGVVNPAALPVGPRRTLAPGRRPAAIAVLKRPVVVSASVVFSPVSVRLTYSVRKRRNSSILRSPLIIGVQTLAKPLNVALVRGRKGSTASRLGAPQIVFASSTSIFGGPGVVLSPSRRVVPKSNLRVPVVVAAPAPSLARPVSVRLVSRGRGRTVVSLGRPVLVLGQALANPVLTRLAYSVRRRGSGSRLFVPALVASNVLARPIDVTVVRGRRGAVASFVGKPLFAFAPATVGGAIGVVLSPSRRGSAKSVLSAPRVISAAIPPLARPVIVALVRSRRSRPIASLSRPTVVSAATFAAVAISVTLASPVRRFGRAALRIPVVVASPPALATRPVSITLTRGRAGHVVSGLFRPVWVFQAALFSPTITISLSPSARSRVRTQLRSPVVVGVATAPLARRISVTLVRGRAGRIVIVGISRPVLVFVPFVSPPLTTTLSPSSRSHARAALRVPVVVTAAAALARPIDTTVVRGRSGVIRSRLYQPSVVGAGIVFRPVKITSTRIAPPKRFWKLQPPAVISQPPAFLPKEIYNLVRGRAGHASPRLAPPAVVGAGIYFRGIKLTLVRGRAGARAKTQLFPPIIPPLARPTSVQLAKPFDRRRQQHSHLSLPTVVTQIIVYPPIHVTLTGPFDRRRLQHSDLHAPAVVGAGIYFRGIDVTVTRITPPKRFLHLQPPTVVAQPPAFLPNERYVLVRGRAGHALPRLSPPAVVGAGIYFPGVKFTLVRGRAGLTRSKLLAPTVVGGPIGIFVVGVHLVRGKAGQTRSKLFAPAVIFPPPPVRPALLFLVRGRRGTPKPNLHPPAVVGAGIVFSPIKKTFGYSFDYRRRSHPRLAPPAVVGAGIYFRGIQVHLAAVAVARKLSIIKYTSRLNPPGPGHLLLPVVMKPGQMWVVRKPLSLFAVDRPQ